MGELFVTSGQLSRQALGEPLLTDGERARLFAKAFYAPLIIVAIACIKPHPKVPEIEQIISAGCAAHGILLPAYAHGFSGIWRTGVNAYDKNVKRGLGLSDAEQIVGFLYLGTAKGHCKNLRDLLVKDFCRPWLLAGSSD